MTGIAGFDGSSVKRRCPDCGIFVGRSKVIKWSDHEAMGVAAGTGMRLKTAGDMSKKIFIT